MALAGRVGSNPTPGATTVKYEEDSGTGRRGKMASEEFRQVVRLANTALDGTKPVEVALTYIRGVSFTLAHAAVVLANIDPSKRLGELSEEELELLERIIRSPVESGVPWWAVNRQRDPSTGEHRHLLGDDVTFAMKQDINLMKKIKCWKGIRHALGLKVRGQRTRTTGRRGRTVGYQRKK